ncbi:hypothetical protein F5Y12DRAFT_712230 [Xylaria sp. FL1777]|nr:hypothetical protein F5Y12DRAFT_712230 [Xylaria sp. FL1777]
MGYYTFDEISSCGREFVIVNIVFTILSIGFLILRFWSALYAGRKFFWDDVCVIVAFVSVTVLNGASFWGTFNGLGKHITELNLEQITILVKDLLISEFAYLGGTGGVKLSMLCLYHRIYTTPTFRRWNYGVMALVVGYVVSFIPLFLTNCIPLSQYWDPKPTGWCRDTIIGDNATLAVNFVLDVFVLALPLPVLWRLRMSTRDKLTVTALFGFGLLTIALIIWRLVITERTRGSPDWTSTLCQVGEIAALEIYLGVIAVCIPTLGPLFNAYIKPLMVRWGWATATSKQGQTNLYLKTFGSSGTNKRTRKYSELNDSIDRIASRDGSIKLTPTMEGKVVSECTFKPINETVTSDNGRGGIRVQRDIEAQYHPKKSVYFEQ